MECPTPCFICRAIVPLYEMKFYTDYCDCQYRTMEGCTHGVCRECENRLDEEDDTDTEPAE